MAMKGKTKIRLATIVLAPLLLAVAYVVFVVRSATEKTELVHRSVARYERFGLTLESVPAEWISHLLAVEDPGFYEHHGVDLTTPGAGLTTISQGLVKIHYFDDFEPGFAKLKQTILAIILDSELTKQQQLVLLLNTARLGTVHGETISGFPDAAEAYFGKGFSELSHREFISLVAMLVAPNRYHVAASPEENAERVNHILAMLAGRCKPEGFRDVYYKNCAAEAALSSQ